MEVCFLIALQAQQTFSACKHGLRRGGFRLGNNALQIEVIAFHLVVTLPGLRVDVN